MNKKFLFVLLLILCASGFFLYFWQIKGQEKESEDFIQKCGDLEDLRGRRVRVIGEVQKARGEVDILVFQESCPISFPDSYKQNLKPEKLKGQLVEVRGVLGKGNGRGDIFDWKFLSIDYLSIVGTSIKVYRRGQSFFLDPSSNAFRKLKAICEKIISSAQIAQINRIPQPEDEIKFDEIALEVKFSSPQYYKVYFMGPITIDVKRILLPLSGENISAQTQKGKKSIFFAFSSEGVSHSPLGTEEDLTKLVRYLID